MKFRFYVTMAVVALLVASCTVQKELVPTGGSRADGTIDMSFEYGAFEKPQIDTNAALAQAQQRCAAWGYSDAESFGSILTKCTAVNGYGGCIRYLATVKYQCTGSPGNARSGGGAIQTRRAPTGVISN